MSPRGSKGLLASILILATGSSLGQFITLAILPIITRLYSPEAFGVLSIFVALSTLLINMSSLQFSEVIVICDSEQDAERAAVISSLLVVAISVLTGVLFWIYAGSAAALLGIEEYGFLLKFLALAVLFGGLELVCRRWLLREHRNRRIASSEVAMAIADRATTVALGLLTAGSPVGLVFGRVIGIFCAFFVALQPKNNRLLRFRFSSGQWRKICELAQRYRRFPYYSWAKLLEISANQLPALLLDAFFGPSVAGGFSLSKRVLAEPAVLLGSAVSQSYFQYAAKQKDDNAVAKATSQLTISLVKLIAFPIFIGLTCAPELIPVVFGNTWEATGWYTFILAPMFMVLFVMRPLNPIFSLKERQREKGIFAAQNILVIVVTLSSTAYFGNDYIALAVLSLASTTYLVYRGIWLMRLVNVDIPALGAALSFSFVVTVAAVLCSIILRTQLLYSGFALVASSCGFTLVYLLLVVLRDEQILKIVRRLRKKD